MKGWDARRLGDLLLKTATVDPTRAPDMLFQYVDVSSVSNESFTIKTTQKLLGKNAPSRARRHIAAGDVIFATVRPTLQRVAIVPDHLDGAVCSTGYFVMRPSPQLDRIYLFYWLFSASFRSEMEKRQRGASYPAVTDGDIREQVIPLPPLEEQRRIVAVLDEAFAAIATATANAKRNLANARELFGNALGAAFADLASTAPEKSMGEIAAIKGGKRVPKGYKLLPEATPYPYLTVGDFTEDGTIDSSEVRFVSEDIHKQIKQYIIRTEDLYVSIAGTIGRTGIVPSEFDGAQLTENACRLVFKDGTSNKFVYFFTKSAAFRRQAIEQTRTAAQPKLALSRLEQIRLPVPDLEVQKTMIKRFSELQDCTADLANLALEKLELLAALKQSLLQRAFTGELTATMPETIAA